MFFQKASKRSHNNYLYYISYISFISDSNANYDTSLSFQLNRVYLGIKYIYN